MLFFIYKSILDETDSVNKSQMIKTGRFLKMSEHYCRGAIKRRGTVLRRLTDKNTDGRLVKRKKNKSPVQRILRETARNE